VIERSELVYLLVQQDKLVNRSISILIDKSRCHFLSLDAH
jgi:hypothetical protein